RGAVAPSCACCSCCCCCLHTIGGLVGGIMGSVSPLREPQSRPRLEELDGPYAVRRDEFEEENLLPAQLVYWFAVLVMICMTCVVCYLPDSTSLRPADSLANGLFVALMILPGLQLGASGLAALILLLFSPNLAQSLRRLGRITAWSFVGFLIGCAALGGCC